MAWAATADQARPEAIRTEAKSLFIRSLQTTLGLSPSAIQFRRTDGPAILVKSSRHSNSSNEADADVYFGSKADMRSRVTSVWVISGHDAFNVRSALHPKSQKFGLTRALLFPRKFYRKKWPAPTAAFALAIAITFVRELQTATLRIFLKATSQPPSTVGTAFGPAGAGGPDRICPLAAREWQFLIVRVVAPGRRLSFGGRDWRSSYQNADKQEP